MAKDPRQDDWRESSVIVPASVPLRPANNLVAGPNPGNAGRLLSVGRIAKPHGLKGEVLVSLTTNRPERMAVGAELQLASGRILTVASSAAHQGRWRVRFSTVPDRRAAEALHGAELFAEAIDDPDALWIHDLIGAEVRLNAGQVVGIVSSVEGSAASDVLVLDDGRMVPLVFVVSHGWPADEGRFVVIIDPPAGLLDENEAV